VSPNHEPRVVDNTARQRFELETEYGTAFADYHVDSETITFPHTVVPRAAEGRGVGSKLIAAALAAARERGLTVVPLCSFVAAYIERHPETQDQVRGY